MPTFTATHTIKIFWPGRVETIPVEEVDGVLYTEAEALAYEAADWTLERDEDGAGWLAFQGQPAERVYRPAELWSESGERVA